jgi:hypothetical protein
MLLSYQEICDEDEKFKLLIKNLILTRDNKKNIMIYKWDYKTQQNY